MVHFFLRIISFGLFLSNAYIFSQYFAYKSPEEPQVAEVRKPSALEAAISNRDMSALKTALAYGIPQDEKRYILEAVANMQSERSHYHTYNAAVTQDQVLKLLFENGITVEDIEKTRQENLANIGLRARIDRMLQPYIVTLSFPKTYKESKANEKRDSTALLGAIKSFDISEVKNLLLKGINPNITGPNQMNALQELATAVNAAKEEKVSSRWSSSSKQESYHMIVYEAEMIGYMLVAAGGRPADYSNQLKKYGVFDQKLVNLLGDSRQKREEELKNEESFVVKVPASPSSARATYTSKEQFPAAPGGVGQQKHSGYAVYTPYPAK